MIQRIHIPRFGGPGVLELRSGPGDPLLPGSVRIRVAACGVNFADLMMRMGLYPEAPPRPFVPGYEVSGEVVEVAEGVSASRPELVVGARVVAVTRFGGYAEEVVVPAAKVFLLPEGWSMVQGAAFPVVFLTAWTALVWMARVRAGDRVLVHGLAGGVGLAALQIAKAAGARVSGTCGGAAKGAAVVERGAERPVDPRLEKVAAAVRGWAPDGVDIVLEPRGSRRLNENLELLAPGGRVVLYGASDAVGGTRRNLLRGAWALLPSLALSPWKLVRLNAGVFGLNVLRLWDAEEMLARALAAMQEGIRAGHYGADVDRTFPFAQAAEAHQYLHERRNIGKVVLSLQ